jgi:hypothetical protein
VEEAVVATRHAGRLLQGHADHRVQGPWGVNVTMTILVQIRANKCPLV